MSESVLAEKLRHEMDHAEALGFQRSTIWLSREDTDAICDALKAKAENAALRKALVEIEAGTILQFEESEEREVEVWMDPEDMQEIARQALNPQQNGKT